MAEFLLKLTHKIYCRGIIPSAWGWIKDEANEEIAPGPVPQYKTINGHSLAKDTSYHHGNTEKLKLFMNFSSVLDRSCGKVRQDEKFVLFSKQGNDNLRKECFII
jgi:hypothetical protein